MKEFLVYMVTGALALFTVTGPLPAYAQETPSSTPPPGEAAYTAEQLDQLLAPIALYPDALLGQVLMAASYPLAREG